MCVVVAGTAKKLKQPNSSTIFFFSFFFLGTAKIYFLTKKLHNASCTLIYDNNLNTTFIYIYRSISHDIFDNRNKFIIFSPKGNAANASGRIFFRFLINIIICVLFFFGFFFFFWEKSSTMTITFCDGQRRVISMSNETIERIFILILFLILFFFLLF